MYSLSLSSLGLELLLAWEQKLKLMILAVLPFFSSRLTILSFDWLIGLRMLMAFLPRKTSEDSASSCLQNTVSSINSLVVGSCVMSSVVFLEDGLDFYLLLPLEKT